MNEEGALRKSTNESLYRVQVGAKKDICQEPRNTDFTNNSSQ